MEEHKRNLSKYQRTDIIQTPFSHNSVINLQITKRKTPCVWKLFIIAKDWKQPNILSVAESINKYYFYTTELYSSGKITSTYVNMNKA